ncbi:YeeE/YedE family protein [Dongia rigui]|uniref:YeeE/YedE family protein n=1 Tax=Dongia rigui TaxID=940149 RepID=A0ABU5DY77_9PROT|nr:YeeE/YedE family protein [Dongia rigui]MDY0872231.1 YeeE/YedE family protein [Dongia rigui]
MDWNAFSPITALAGGALIGLAALILMAGIGRIAGISGIIGSLISQPRADFGWRLLFLVGMALGAFNMAKTLGGFAPSTSANLPGLIVAGLLVGYGTRLGSGCTSGHGICGLARLSPRSLAAVAVFMAAGMLTTFVMRHVVGG